MKCIIHFATGRFETSTFQILVIFLNILFTKNSKKSYGYVISYDFVNQKIRFSGAGFIESLLLFLIHLRKKVILLSFFLFENLNFGANSKQKIIGPKTDSIICIPKEEKEEVHLWQVAMEIQGYNTRKFDVRQAVDRKTYVKSQCNILKRSCCADLTQ